MEVSILVQGFEISPRDFRKAAESELQSRIAWGMARDAAVLCRNKEALVKLYLHSAEKLIERVRQGESYV